MIRTMNIPSLLFRPILVDLNEFLPVNLPITGVCVSDADFRIFVSLM